MYKTENKVFWNILNNTHGRTSSRVARDLNVSSSCVRNWFRALEERGFIQRDWRKQNIRWSVTEAGKAFAAGFEGEDSVPTIEDDAVEEASVEVPASVIETYEVTESGEVRHPTYAKVQRCIAGGIRVIWLTGEAGVGKTFAVRQIAKDLGYALFVATPVCDKYELLGFKDANGNAVPTEVYRWATHDGPAVLLLDEVDGNLAPAMLCMNSMLANDMAVFPDGQVTIAKNKVVIATANTTGQGATIKYCGRQALDHAFVDRFQVQLHWGLHEATEKLIANLEAPGCDRTVEASWKIRRNLERYGMDLDWGPRRTYALCTLVHNGAGFSVREAAVMAGLSRLEDEEQANALEGVC